MTRPMIYIQESKDTASVAIGTFHRSRRILFVRTDAQSKHLRKQTHQPCAPIATLLVKSVLTRVAFVHRQASAEPINFIL